MWFYTKYWMAAVAAVAAVAAAAAYV